MTEEFLLEVEHLKLKFNDLQVLGGIALQLRRGEVVSVIGRSGCGKTVLLRTLAGLLKANEGQIHFYSTSAAPIGFVFQKSPLFPWLTVAENLNLCLQNHTTDKKKIDDLLRIVGLEAFKNHLPREISGGMAQKLNLLRALANNCELILMDEPFASLDGIQRSELQQFTFEVCRDRNRSLLLVTHDIDEALLLSDRIYVLSSQTGTFTSQIVVGGEKPPQVIEFRSHPKYNLLFKEVLTALIDAERPK